MAKLDAIKTAAIKITKLGGTKRKDIADLLKAEKKVSELEKIKNPSITQKAELVSAKALIRRVRRESSEEVTKAARKGKQTLRDRKTKSQVTLGKEMPPSKTKLEDTKPIKGLHYRGGGMVTKKINNDMRTLGMFKGGLPKKNHGKSGPYGTTK